MDRPAPAITRIFGFILLVVVSSSVAELHGARAANTLVRFGFVPSVFSTLLSLVVVELPPAPDMDYDRLAAFELMLGRPPGSGSPASSPTASRRPST